MVSYEKRDGARERGSEGCRKWRKEKKKSHLPGEHSAEVDLARGPAEEGRLGQVLGEGGVVEPDVGLDELFFFFFFLFFFFFEVEREREGERRSEKKKKGRRLSLLPRFPPSLVRFYISPPGPARRRRRAWPSGSGRARPGGACFFFFIESEEFGEGESESEIKR